MTNFTIEVDNGPSIRFTGEELARVLSSPNRDRTSFSGQTGRWTELALYKTKSGRFICHQIGHTQWQGERTRYSAEVCGSIDEVKAFFGHKWLAQELYDEAGIEDVLEVD